MAATTCLLIILTDEAIKHTCIWSLVWRNKYKPYNSSTPIQWFLIFLFTSQREREAMKDEMAHHGAMDKSYSEQQICVSASIFCIVRKNWPYRPTISGSYSRWQEGRQARRQAGRLAGWKAGKQADEIWVGLETFKIIYRELFGFLFCSILLKCYKYISVGFHQVKLV